MLKTTIGQKSFLLAFNSLKNSGQCMQVLDDFDVAWSLLGGRRARLIEKLRLSNLTSPLGLLFLFHRCHLSRCFSGFCIVFMIISRTKQTTQRALKHDFPAPLDTRPGAPPAPCPFGPGPWLRAVRCSIQKRCTTLLWRTGLAAVDFFSTRTPVIPVQKAVLLFEWIVGNMCTLRATV